MKTLPNWAIPEIYAVNSTNPWYHFLDITFNTTPTPTLYHFVRNTEDATWNDVPYTAFPFDPDVHHETGSGEIPTRMIKVSNVLRLLENEIEALGGAVASQIVWTTVSAKNISTSTASNYADFQVTFEILGTKANTQWVTFTLGAPFINLQRFPLEIYNANFCSWLRVYGITGQECNYQGALPSCDGTLNGPNGCSVHNNTVNFGGYPGLISSDFMVAV